MARKKRTAFRILKGLLMAGGLFFLLLVILAFTTLPFHAMHRLATRGSVLRQPPAVIVMLGGAGIPSESGLMRTYYTALLASEYPEAKIVVAIPGDEAADSDLQLAVGELVLRGVEKRRISYEPRGKNTRAQALNLSHQLLAHKQKPIALVTPPEHMKRAVLSFRRCGFTQVGGMPAFESPLETSLLFNDRELKGNRIAPRIGKNLQLRYQFWNHLKYEVIVLREYFALAYYKLRGWV